MQTKTNLEKFLSQIGPTKWLINNQAVSNDSKTGKWCVTFFKTVLAINLPTINKERLTYTQANTYDAKNNPHNRDYYMSDIGVTCHKLLRKRRHAL